MKQLEADTFAEWLKGTMLKRAFKIFLFQFRIIFSHYFLITAQLLLGINQQTNDITHFKHGTCNTLFRINNLFDEYHYSILGYWQLFGVFFYLFNLS